MRRRNQGGLPIFDAAAHYVYPEHLRCWLEGMPSSSGVYLFHGESESLPLYIGKSVNIRSRVMAHLRNPEESPLLHQSRRITWIETAGELGALLLEAQLIKLQQPLFNKRLRRNRQLCALRWDGERPEVVSANNVDFARTESLYGLFANRRSALEKLRSLADLHQLCYGLLGLESVSQGRACFRAGLHRCAGACCGREPVSQHQERFSQALAELKVVCWPWQGAVAVEETGASLRQFHIINNWFYLGSVETPEQAASLQSSHPGFDIDGYKILCRLLLSDKYNIIKL
ncbi:nucleotide excision repair endonuclease [Salmonella enterica subsp. enterica serovar Choleraesuis]|nr:nucleotide excision repair endonuclease [Salmonella enterica subsp. enterica serovar Choleraesuis]